jgi:CheY-like chemotaxis protein
MATGPEETRGSLQRVVVADDSRVFRAITCETLRQHGLEVIEAADGSEALQILVAKRPQLVILDALMPMVSGFAVMDKLPEMAPDYHPVIFFVTAVYKSRRWEAEARKKYKVAEYLEKPIEPEDLVRAIARHFPGFLGGVGEKA